MQKLNHTVANLTFQANACSAKTSVSTAFRPAAERSFLLQQIDADVPANNLLQLVKCASEPPIQRSIKLVKALKWPGHSQRQEFPL